MPPIKEFTCRGLNYSVILRSDRMTIKSTGWGNSNFHELPLRRIDALIVQRKSIIPFATFTVLAAIATALTRYNELWLLLNLTAQEEAALSTVALLATILCAIPTVSRALFVNVTISWAGRPKSFLVRLVPAHQAMRLARRFHRACSGS